MAEYGENIISGAGVELSPHLDLWMKWARFGEVLRIKDKVARVRLDIDRKSGKSRLAWIRVEDLIRR